MDESYDFVAQHGTTHVILGSGARVQPAGPLPLEAGTHLVAGKARLGGFRILHTFPPEVPAQQFHLSPDHRWLGVSHEDALTLYDLRNRFRPGFVFHPPSARTCFLSIHPSGEMLALRTDTVVEILLPDDQLLTAADFARDEKEWYGEHLSFSACGEYLWFAHHPPGGPDLLWLLRVPTLEPIDHIAVPFDPNGYYDEPDAGWAELGGLVSPLNYLTLKRTAGDSFLGITFHRAEGGRIITHPHRGPLEPVDDDGPIHEVAFSPDARRFVCFNRHGFIWEWTWPDCTLLASAHDLDLKPSNALHLGDHRDLVEIAYWNDLVLVTLGTRTYPAEVHLLHSGSLQRVGLLTEFLDGWLLPNGMLVTVASNDSLQVRALEGPGEEIPVVIELHSDAGAVERVVQRQETGWVEVTHQTAWVKPNFDVARGLSQ